MAKAERDGFARWVLRKRAYAGALRLHEGFLALVSLRSSNQVLAASDLDAPGGRELEEKERGLAKQLVDALSGPFEHAPVRDECRDRVLALVADKQKGKKVRLVRYRPEPVAEGSLEDALRRSLKAAG